MTTPIDIRADHLRIVHDVLARHLPNGVRVSVFGSRATWATKDSSDLDLALEGDGEIPARSLSELESAFEDSDLPYAVDVVDVKRIAARFRELVTQQRVPLPENASSHPTDWPIMSLREAGISLIDCEHRTPPASDDGYPYVGIPQIKDGRVDLGGARRIAQEHFREWTRKANPRPFDVVLSRRCNPGETGFVSARSFEFALGQNLVLLRADGERILKPFLRWLVRSPEWWNQIAKYLNVGAVFDSLKCVDIPEFLLPIPPLPDQRVIARILGTLDDKIELNRRMNATLEAMAQALFRSWFVDFDPVRAKMEGRDTGLPNRVADLFPDRLVGSRLGDTPEGWTVGTLGDIAEPSGTGVDPRAVAQDTPYIGLEHMPRHSVALTDWGSAGSVSSNKSGFSKGDVLFGKLRPYFHKVGIAPVNGVCSTDIVVLTARMPELSAFVLAGVSSPDFVSYTNQTSTGTKMPRTSWRSMSRYELCLPAEPMAEAFQCAAGPMLARILENIHESHTLCALRGALLPSLISGEVRVRDAERLVGAIA